MAVAYRARLRACNGCILFDHGFEYIYDRHSPVGYSAIPQALGGSGSIVNANFELYF